MTQRERQILQWIEQDPMISQEALAEKAGITRSSVAVHISNLMKKGYIVGKGYVLRTGTYAVVVGGVNMDIGGKSYNPLVPNDSNPGEVHMSLGGVGRNIAHNMALLGVETRLLTAFGDDLYAEKIAGSCGELGIDISGALKIPGASTSTYLYIAGPDGEMEMAVSDMDICKEITPEYLAGKMHVLNNAQLVVADTNIPQESLKFLAEHCSVPIFIDPVSTAKAVKIKSILDKIHTLKPNKLEAELLSGVKINDTQDLEKAADILLDTGLRRVFISLGSDGVFAADHKEKMIVPCKKVEPLNMTGAGDAFMAGLVWAYLEGTDLKTTAIAASSAGAIAIEGEDTINPQMSVKRLQEMMAR